MDQQTFENALTRLFNKLVDDRSKLDQVLPGIDIPGVQKQLRQFLMTEVHKMIEEPDFRSNIMVLNEF